MILTLVVLLFILVSSIYVTLYTGAMLVAFGVDAFLPQYEEENTRLVFRTALIIYVLTCTVRMLPLY
jgi:membrane glycosyltransferase